MIITGIFLIFGTSCKKLEEDETPTKSRMEGVWVLKEAYNDQDSSIVNRFNFPITGLYLGSDRTILASAGPMIMYIVYGDNKYTDIASHIDQVFNYASLDFNGGEYFISGGVVTRFTLEMKLEGLPGQAALTDLLDIIGIGNDYLDVVVYHKFMDVGISFSDDNQTMTWTIDDSTSAVYNTKDQYGNYVLWQGWPVTSFTKGKFVFVKQVKDLKDVVEEAAQADSTKSLIIKPEN